MSVTARPLPMAADLYGDIEPSPKANIRDYLPGLLIVLLGTLAAGFISDHYGAPLTLMSLLIGLALNFLSADSRLTPASPSRRDRCCAGGSCWSGCASPSARSSRSGRSR